MSRGSYSVGKRRREADKARKRKEKEERRRSNREKNVGGGIPIASVEEIQSAAMVSPGEVMDAATGDQPAEERRPAGIPSRLFVGGLSWETNSDDLRTTFEAFGPVTDAVIVTDRDTGHSRGFGFVTMESRRDAAKAIRELNGEELDGRTIVVKQATERPR